MPGCQFIACGVGLSPPPVVRKIERALRARKFGPPGPRPRVCGGPFMPTSRSATDPLADDLRDTSHDHSTFFAAAQQLSFPLDRLEAALPRDLRTALDSLWEHRHDAARIRADLINDMLVWMTELEPFHQEMRRLQPPRIAEITNEANLAMLGICLNALEWPHTTFLREFAYCGFSVAGPVADSHLFSLKAPHVLAAEEENRLDFDVWQQSNADANLATVARLKAAFRRDQDDPAKVADYQALWREAKKELDEGTSMGPFSISATNEKYGYGRWRGTESFIVHQEAKDRPVDNHKKSGFNRTFTTRESVALPPADAQAACARHMYRHGEREGKLHEAQYMSGGDDEPHAYRNNASAQPQYTLVFLVDPATGDVVVVARRGLSFGQAGAVLAYVKKPEAACAILCVFFLSPTTHYIDDFQEGDLAIATGPPPTAPMGPRPFSAQGCAEFVCSKIFGRPMAPMKRLRLTVKPSSCGITTDLSNMISEGTVTVGVTEAAAAKFVASAGAVLASSDLSPPAARSLVGRGRHVTAWSLAGRGAMQPIQERANAPDDLSDTSLSHEGRASLVFLTEFLADIESSRLTIHLPASRPPPVVVFSDAAWKPRPPLLYGVGEVATVVRDPEHAASRRLVFAASPVPDSAFEWLQRLRPQRQPITALEVMALVAVLFMPEVAESLRGRDIYFWADNTAANSASARGYSSSPDIARLVHAFHLRALDLNCRIWIEWVPSVLNIADLPSRGDFALLNNLGATRIPFTFPPVF